MKPEPGTPEFDEWLKNKTQDDLKELFKKPIDFDEVEGIAGDESILGKSDSELFPSDIEEKTPTERRRLIKEIKKINKADDA